MNCTLCPKNCRCSRNNGERGFCGETSDVRIAAALLHSGEEPPITASGGSGTVFVTGCSLGCAFCQNYQISQQGMGRVVDEYEGSDIFLTLQDKGAENINIVTGSHAVPGIAAMIARARKNGLSVPVCWNSSSYETIDALEMLDGLVDIWLPDLKTLNPIISADVFGAPDYPYAAKKAIRWMMKHASTKMVPLTKPPKIPGSGTEKMMSGVIIRHLVLPGRLDDSRLVLDWLKTHAEGAMADGGDPCVSIMSQYTPVEVTSLTSTAQERREKALQSFQNRLLNQQEFSSIRQMIESYDFTHLFYQELDSSTDWLPDFSKRQLFPSSLAVPLWHWTDPVFKR